MTVCTRYGLIDGGYVRTFHLRVEVAKRGGRLARYAHRLDGVREEELESTGGMPVPAFEAAAAEREQLHQRRGEWKAPAYHMILELPLEFPPPARHRVMDAVGAHFTEAGHAVTWAVHGTNEHGAVQPHGHVIPLAADAADGTACRPVEGGGAMRALRGFVAGTVNAVAAEAAIPLPAAWHPGSFQDIGNPRPPRTRQAVAVYKARGDHVRGRALSARPGRDVTEAVSKTPRRLAAQRPMMAGPGVSGARPEALAPEPESAGLERADGRGEAGANSRAARGDGAEATADELRDSQQRIAALERAFAQTCANGQLDRGEQA